MKHCEKKKSKLALIIGITIVLLFILARYGWRIEGLRACSSAYSVEITVSEETVDVEGYTVNPFGHFIGHIYKIDGDRLHVGVKERQFLGVLPWDKEEFHIQIPIEEPINEVYLCAGDNERLEWTRSSDASE